MPKLGSWAAATAPSSDNGFCLHLPARLFGIQRYQISPLCLHYTQASLTFRFLIADDQNACETRSNWQPKHLCYGKSQANGDFLRCTGNEERFRKWGNFTVFRSRILDNLEMLLNLDVWGIISSCMIFWFAVWQPLRCILTHCMRTSPMTTRK